MSEFSGRQERKMARQAKRAAQGKDGEKTPEERKQARMRRRAARGELVPGEPGSPSPPGAKPGEPRNRLERKARGKAAGAGAGKAGRGDKGAGKNHEAGMQGYLETMQAFRRNAERADYPDRLHENCRDGVLFPAFQPKFKLDLGPDAKIFTIGAGFARDVEPALAARGVNVPTAAITMPPAGPVRAENPLNEYTPASIAQRITGVFREMRMPKGTIIEAGPLLSDQLLPSQFNDTLENLEARRAEIAGIYARLRECGALIVTLSSAETWYDGQTKRFFNRPPPVPNARSRVTHIYFALQDPGEAAALLSKPFAQLGAAGIKIVLTVSPVAQRTTYSGVDAVTANEASKAVLRAAAQRLVQKFEHVDYFPAYEIARSAGLQAYMDDNVQLREEFATMLVAAFIKAYAA